MDNVRETKQLIRVKRQVNEENLLIHNKRCKFVGSVQHQSDDLVKQLFSDLKLIQRQDEQLAIVDYGDYQQLLSEISKDQFSGFPRINETITCNGEPLVGSKSQDDYIYDIFIYEEDELVNEDYRDECGEEEEVSSNDENYLYNDYPDENEVDEEEADFYREWEDDEDREVRIRMEKSGLSSNEESDSDSEADFD